jgi:ABC-type uncharacterized transport system permease subunit
MKTEMNKGNMSETVGVFVAFAIATVWSSLNLTMFVGFPIAMIIGFIVAHKLNKNQTKEKAL